MRPRQLIRGLDEGEIKLALTQATRKLHHTTTKKNDKHANLCTCSDLGRANAKHAHPTKEPYRRKVYEMMRAPAAMVSSMRTAVTFLSL